MIIKRFIDFVNEAYLKGSRAPLYHFTAKLQNIIYSDKLLTSRPSRPSHNKERSISLTRNINYIEYKGFPCIELDIDELKSDGIKVFPVDEWAWTKTGEPNKDVIKKYHMGKANFKEIKSGKRGTSHGLNLPKNPTLEIEFEERIFKNIDNVGKYIISIYLQKHSLERLEKEIHNYLKKYPHIKIYLYNTDIRKGKDITEEILKVREPEKVK